VLRDGIVGDESGVAAGDACTVGTDLLQRAEQGEVDQAEFIDCVRTSLPYACQRRDPRR
jgi:hypothetical protein